jgi:hypothetical protein
METVFTLEKFPNSEGNHNPHTLLANQDGASRTSMGSCRLLEIPAAAHSLSGLPGLTSWSFFLLRSERCHVYLGHLVLCPELCRWALNYESISQRPSPQMALAVSTQSRVSVAKMCSYKIRGRLVQVIAIFQSCGL